MPSAGIVAGFFQVKQELTKERWGYLADLLDRLGIAVVRKQLDLLTIEAQSTICHPRGFAINEKSFLSVQQVIVNGRKNLKSPLDLDFCGHLAHSFVFCAPNTTICGGYNQKTTYIQVFLSGSRRAKHAEIALRYGLKIHMLEQSI